MIASTPCVEPQRLPVVLTRGEVEALLVCLDGVPWIVAVLLYGSRLRRMECPRRRVKDISISPEARFSAAKASWDRLEQGEALERIAPLE